jgi:mannitol/fructose-specific phosphotransferase system IIA component (Ntr-type)
MRLADLTRPELIFPHLAGSDREAVLRMLARLAVEQGIDQDPEALFKKLWEREQLASTGIGSGVAIPHCKIKRSDKVLLAVGRHPAGVDFDAIDAQPVKLFFLVISPEKSPAAHLQCLAGISKWVKGADHVARLLALDDPQEIFQLLSEDPA